MTWDVTVSDTMAESYLSSASTLAGSVAENAANRNTNRSPLLTPASRWPWKLSDPSPINTKGVEFSNILCHRPTAHSGDMRETVFLFQRLSLTIQRFNTVCFQGSFNSTLADSDT